MWQRAYAFGFVKMVSQFANWAPAGPFYTTGRECFSGWKSSSKAMTNQACATMCKSATRVWPAACYCTTAFYNGLAQVGLDLSFNGK